MSYLKSILKSLLLFFSRDGYLKKEFEKLIEHFLYCNGNDGFKMEKFLFSKDIEFEVRWSEEEDGDDVFLIESDVNLQEMFDGSWFVAWVNDDDVDDCIVGNVWGKKPKVLVAL